jgi:hypothetical protein
MIDLVRFDEVRKRIERETAESLELVRTAERGFKEESEKNSQLARVAQWIKSNIDRTRNYNPIPQRVNLLTSNLRQTGDSLGDMVLDYLRKDGLHLEGRYESFKEKSEEHSSSETRMFCENVLGYFSDRGDPLSQGIIKTMNDFATKTHYSTRLSCLCPIPNFHPVGIVNKLLHRTMKEEEYRDYLEGRKPFTVFEYKDEKVELRINPERAEAA